MSSEVQGDIIVSDGEHEIDVAKQRVCLICHMVRYDPEVSWNGYRVALGKSMDDVRNVLDGNERGMGLMSDIDPEVVRLIRDLLIQTDMLGVGHQTRALEIAHRLDLAGKVIIDKGSAPE